MDANSLLAIVFIGLFLLCFGCLATAAFVVLRFTNGSSTDITVSPRPKLFARAPKAESTPSLVGAPKVTSSVTPEADADSVSHVDTDKSDEYLEIQEVPKSLLSEAVENYLRGEGNGKEAIAAATEEAES